jgi:hypothetical protein
MSGAEMLTVSVLLIAFMRVPFLILVVRLQTVTGRARPASWLAAFAFRVRQAQYSLSGCPNKTGEYSGVVWGRTISPQEKPSSATIGGCQET